MNTANSKTDDSKLVTTGIVCASQNGGDTNEPFPRPNANRDIAELQFLTETY